MRAIVAALCILAASLGWMMGLQANETPAVGSNAATWEQVRHTCYEAADALAEGAESYQEYESMVPKAIEARRECGRWR